MKLLLYSELKSSFDKLEYNDPIKGPDNVYFGKIEHAGSPLYIQTPKLKGLRSNDFLVCELTRENPFYSFLTELDENNVLAAVQNSSEWFKQTLSKDDLLETYRSTIQVGTEGTTARFRLSPDVKVYGSNQKEVHLGSEPCEIQLILKLKGLNFYSTAFTTNWEVCQVKVNAPPVKKVSFENYAFIDSDSEEFDIPESDSE